jgi:hypothetical protein
LACNSTSCYAEPLFGDAVTATWPTDDNLNFKIDVPQAPISAAVGILMPGSQYLQLPFYFEVCGYEVISPNPAAVFDLDRATHLTGTPLAAVLASNMTEGDYSVNLRSLFSSTSSDDYCAITTYTLTD